MSEPNTQKTVLTDAEKAAIVRSTRRLDLRRILGALFLLYGILTTIVGFVHWSTDTVKTSGIHINLWVGICMLVGGGLFFLWDHFAPVPADDIIGQAESEDEIKPAGEGHGLA